MKTKLLVGVATLALIAGTGIASAQSGAQQDMKSGQQTAPSAQKSQEAPSQGQGGQTQSQPSGERPGSAQTQDTEKKAQQGNKENTQQRQGQQDRNGANQRQTRDRDDDKQRQTRDRDGDKDSKKRDGQAQTESKPGGGKDAKVDLNSEQRTKISQTIKTQNVRRVNNVNFNISVGVVVPRNYTFYPIPATVVTVVPAWRGYLYLVVGDEMLIIHPRTHEIVAVIAV